MPDGASDAGRSDRAGSVVLESAALVRGDNTKEGARMSDAEEIARWLEEHADDEEYSTMFHDVTHGEWIRVPVPHLLAEAVRAGAWREPAKQDGGTAPDDWSDDELAAEFSEALGNIRMAGQAMEARIVEFREDRDAAVERYHKVGYAQAVSDVEHWLQGLADDAQAEANDPRFSREYRMKHRDVAIAHRVLLGLLPGAIV